MGRKGMPRSILGIGDGHDHRYLCGDIGMDRSHDCIVSGEQSVCICT